MSRRAASLARLLPLLFVAANLPANAVAQGVAANRDRDGHFVDPGNSAPLRTTESVLTETFDDPLGGWRTRWLALNTNMRNAYVGSDNSDENYRGNNPCGLWISDDANYIPFPFNTVVIRFSQPFGAHITHLEMGIQAFIFGACLVYDPSGNEITNLSLAPNSPNYVPPFGCYTTNYAVNSPNGIGRFEITSVQNQVRGNFAIDNVIATIDGPTPVQPQSWGRMKLIYR